MSTPGSPYGELPPTQVAEVALDGHDHHWFAEPTEAVGRKYIVGLVVAQLVFFIALLGPATIGLGVKVQAIVPDEQKTSALGIVAGFGALFAVIGNVLVYADNNHMTPTFARSLVPVLERHLDEALAAR